MSEKHTMIMRVEGSSTEQLLKLFSGKHDLKNNIGQEEKIVIGKLEITVVPTYLDRIIFDTMPGESIAEAVKCVFDFVTKYKLREFCRRMFIVFNGVMVPVLESPEEMVGYYHGFLDGSRKK